MNRRIAAALFAACVTTGLPLASIAFAVPAAAAEAAYNRDMSKYDGLAKEMLALIAKNDLKSAHKKSKELEKAFDKGTADLKKADAALWTKIDTQMDVAIQACKGTDAKVAKAETDKFIAYLAEAAK